MGEHEDQQAVDCIQQWCKDNAILDVRPFRWDSRAWLLAWPTYTYNCDERVIRGIQVDFPSMFDDCYTVRLNVFRNHKYPPLLVCKPRVQRCPLGGLRTTLDDFKAVADALGEDDLVPFER